MDNKKTIGEHYIDFMMHAIFVHQEAEQLMLNELKTRNNDNGKLVFCYKEEIPLTEVKLPELISPLDSSESH